jgi:hypothetical protein
MQRFEMGVAVRGSIAPEVKRFVEAESMREAIRKITEQFGGAEVALVTYAQFSPPIDAPVSRSCQPGSFTLAPPCSV